MLARVVVCLAVYSLAVQAQRGCNPEWSNYNIGTNSPLKDTGEKADLGTLKLVHVVFRHGDRTPDETSLYPKDPHFNETYYPIGHGQLTNLGKQQEYLIGKDLRKRYDEFLGDLYTPDILDARSTNYNRTKNSLELMLAGLWPPAKSQTWNVELPWQPIPYNYWTAQEDALLNPFDACPIVSDLYEKYLSSDEFLQDNDKLKEFYSYMSENTGLNISIPEDVYDIFFTLFAEEQMGFPLPSWTKCVWPNMITKVAIQYYYMVTSSNAIKQYTAGVFLDKIIQDSKSFIDSVLKPSGRKIFIYSAHEVNVALTLIGLRLFYPHVPPYASYVLIELHQIDGIYGFKVFYQDYRYKDPRLLTIPGCESFCPFDKFYELFKNDLPSYGC